MESGAREKRILAADGKPAQSATVFAVVLGFSPF